MMRRSGLVIGVSCDIQRDIISSITLTASQREYSDIQIILEAQSFYRLGRNPRTFTFEDLKSAIFCFKFADS